MRTATLIPMFALALLASACINEDGEAPNHERSAQVQFEPAKLPESAARGRLADVNPTVATPELPSPPTTTPAAMPEQWQAWVDTEVARVQNEAPAWFDHMMTVQPKRTRSGFLRLVGPELEDPNAVPVLLHRYLTAGESPDVKAAVVAALFRTQGDLSSRPGHRADYAKVIADLVANEPDALVRVGMVSSLRRVPGPDALAAIEVALADADVQVRVTAATVAGRHPEGATIAAALVDVLDDVPDVQIAAARSLGYLHVESASPALTQLLASSNADVRLSSLQAIDRIDPAYAEGLSQLAALVDDADPTVARAAQKIASR
jgi:HEAT repeat protein